MKITIEIRCDGAAFEDEGEDIEVAYVLRQVPGHVQKAHRHTASGVQEMNLLDTNGNTCGELRVWT